MLRQGAIADTEDDNHRLGVVLAEQTTRTLQSVDLVLQDLAAQIAVAWACTTAICCHALFGGADVHEALKQRLSDLPQANALSVIDSTGHFVNQTRPWPSPGLHGRRPELFPLFRQHGGSQSLHLGTGSRPGHRPADGVFSCVG